MIKYQFWNDPFGYNMKSILERGQRGFRENSSLPLIRNEGSLDYDGGSKKDDSQKDASG